MIAMYVSSESIVRASFQPVPSMSSCSSSRPTLR
jgi:hypothetical protein